MGAWNELDTKITVTSDTDFEELQALGREPYFQGLTGLAFQMDNAFKRIEKKAVKDLAVHNRSVQQRLLSDLSEHPYSQGMLASSIEEKPSGDNSYLIGTRISHIYPLCVEKGRGPITATKAKALAFYSLSGELVFRKSVGPAPARPFVKPAFSETERIAEKVVTSLIKKELGKILGQ